MSDDEVSRRRLPWVAVAGLAAIGLFAWWWRAQTMDEYRVFKGFCSASHPGEVWDHVKSRAAEHEWLPVRQSREGTQPEEWLFVHEFSSFRAGCVVTVAKGRVQSTRFAELPRK